MVGVEMMKMMVVFIDCYDSVAIENIAEGQRSLRWSNNNQIRFDAQDPNR
jgi:hypothetical protein